MRDQPVSQSVRRGESPEEVFEALLAKWWNPLYDQMCEQGGGQPMHSSLAFYEKERKAWRERWREATVRSAELAEAQRDRYGAALEQICQGDFPMATVTEDMQRIAMEALDV